MVLRCCVNGMLEDKNLPPLELKLGDIIKIFPSVDNSIRVVSVKTPSGIMKRATTKIYVLPIGT